MPSRIVVSGFAAVLVALALTACGATRTQTVRVTPLPPATATPAGASDPGPTPTAAPAEASATPPASPTPLPAASATPSPTPTERATARPTATPLELDLTEGSAREIALAQDQVLQPTPRARVTFDESPVAMTFDEFYDGFSVRSGLILSDKLVSLDGQQVVLEGYMAPPLKPDLDFFVLTRIPLAVCPFCSTDADWPFDIALIYMPNGEFTLATQYPVRVTGQMEVGSQMDVESGMVSLVRIYAEDVERVQ